MRVAFRTDASIQIGTGHVMRCLTLADALRARGAHCCFICREHPGNLLELIRRRGYVTHALPAADDGCGRNDGPAYASWLGTDWVADAEQTRLALDGQSVDWLVVDHYALDISWERALRARCRRLMVIDDLADRPHHCDLLLDQNLGRTEQDYRNLLNLGARVLIGPQYALLRPEFAQWREHSLARRAQPQLKCLLITMGGVDKDNVTGQVLAVLKERVAPLDLLRITVVLGPHAPWLLKVQDQAATMPQPTQVLVGISNMAQVMAESDLAIGAAGSTSWERCCLGLPTIQMVLAENQKESAKALAAVGAAMLVNGSIALATTIQQLGCGDLKQMTQSASKVCDGQGAMSIVRALQH